MYKLTLNTISIIFYVYKIFSYTLRWQIFFNCMFIGWIKSVKISYITGIFNTISNDSHLNQNPCTYYS